MDSAASHSQHAMHAHASAASLHGKPAFSGASIAPSNIAAAFSDLSWTTTILVLVATLLVVEQSVYRYKKAHLPGAKWTIPVIGKFAGVPLSLPAWLAGSPLLTHAFSWTEILTDSLAPTMEKYKKTWATPLAAVSVFNM